MATPIAALEKYLKQELTNISAVTTAVSTRVNNSVAPQNIINTGPHLIFTITPLDDNFGQKRTTLQSNFLVDIIFISKLPLHENIDPAIEAIHTHFDEVSAATFSGYRVSLRHQKPISQTRPGATEGEYLLYRGGTYRAFLT